jgi:hypothetical protein
MINAEHLKGSAFNAEVLLGGRKSWADDQFYYCTDGQQLNKQYDHNYFLNNLMFLLVQTHKKKKETTNNSLKKE